MIEVLQDFYGKEALSEGVNPVKNTAERPVCGYGYVILSRDYNRADYIERSFRNNILNIITDRNEIIKDCYVGENVWNYIKFPKSIRTKGSCVVWLCAPNSNRVTIIATITKRDELQQLNTENSFKLLRESELGTISIEGDVNKGILNFVVNSDIENGAKVTWRILNSLVQGLFDIYIQGSLKIEVDDTLKIKIKNELDITFIDDFNPDTSTNINYTLSKGYVMVDEFGNQVALDANGYHIKVPAGEKLIFEGSTPTQNSVLGITLMNLLKELISKIEAITVMTPSGVSSTPLNVLDFTLISAKLKTILSQINFLS